MNENSTPTSARTSAPVGTLRAGVAEEVRALLARRRMSSTALARHIAKSHTYVWRRLNGETAFDLDDMEAIATALGVNIRALLPAPPPGDTSRSHAGVVTLPAAHAMPMGIPRQVNRRPDDGRPAGHPGTNTRPDGQRRTSRLA